MTRRIEPRTLKGFRDILPDQMLRKEAVLAAARDVFRSYGFVPIDTPVLEYSEILLAKVGGETEKQVYRFDDQGGRDVSMRFDLTVPLARFAATHVRHLGTPFKRYHMGPVWRGENTARGRFREFWQCDFDTIGTTSSMADLETALVIVRLLERLRVGPFTLHLSDRGVLSGLVARLGASERYLEILRAIDKLAKAGRSKVEAELASEAGLDATAIAEIFSLIELEGDQATVLAEVESRLGDEPSAREGIERLRVVTGGLAAAGVPDGSVRLDLSIARGLDYYTGTIFETFLDGHREYGSVCSGGRYDDLASLYTKDVLPGVGASLGLDRLLDALEVIGVTEDHASVQVLVLYLDVACRDDVVRIAEELRRAGILTELYPEPKKIQKQLQHAGRRGARVAVIVGPDELERGVASVKNLTTGEQRSDVPRADLAAVVLDVLTAVTSGDIR